MGRNQARRKKRRRERLAHAAMVAPGFLLKLLERVPILPVKEMADIALATNPILEDLVWKDGDDPPLPRPSIEELQALGENAERLYREGRLCMGALPVTDPLPDP